MIFLSLLAGEQNRKAEAKMPCLLQQVTFDDVIAKCASATAVSSAIHHLFGSPGFTEIADWPVREQCPRRTVDHPVDVTPRHC